MFVFCQPITDVYCGQLTNESARFLWHSIYELSLVKIRGNLEAKSFFQTPVFKVHFFALFGITGYEDVMASNYIQSIFPQTDCEYPVISTNPFLGWTLYAFKLVFASYLTLSIIVLINLLIAMMSDTYCRIQEQSDIGIK